MVNSDPNHKHVYDAQGKMICCSQEEKIYQEADAEELLVEQTAEEAVDDDHGHKHDNDSKRGLRQYLPVLISLTMLLAGIALDAYFKPSFFTGSIRLIWYLIAYLPVAFPVIKEGWKAMTAGEFFPEFSLMVLATVGAFAIGEYPKVGSPYLKPGGT